MLHILLMILKIALWIILGILGLLFVLMLLVLFVPISYKVDAKYDKTAYVYARVRFLIFGVRLLFDQQKNIINNDIRILGIKLKLSGSKKKKKKSKKNDIETSQLIISDEPQAIDKTDVFGDSEVIDKPDVFGDSEVIDEPDVFGDSEAIDKPGVLDETEPFDISDKDNLDLPKEEKKVFGRIKAFFKGIINKVVNIYKKIEDFNPEEISDKIERKKKEINNKINRLKKFWNAKCTVKTRAYLIKYIKTLVKHISPRRIKGYVRYGFDEPYKTGQITGYLSLIPLVYQKGFSLEPDFYNKVIEADVKLRGRIQLIYLVRIAVNINLWRTVKLAKKVMK